MLAFGTLFSCQEAAARAPLEPYAVSQAKLRALVSFRKLVRDRFRSRPHPVFQCQAGRRYYRGPDTDDKPGVARLKSPTGWWVAKALIPRPDTE